MYTAVPRQNVQHALSIDAVEQSNVYVKLLFTEFNLVQFLHR